MWILRPVLLSLLLATIVCESHAGPGTEAKQFELLSSEATGIRFQNGLPIDRELNILLFDYYYNGGGVAIGDLDDDGLPEIFLTANLKPNRLYLNKGNLQFEDITESAGVAGSSRWSTGATMADVNADGLLDLYVCASGPFPEDERRNELFINNGDLTFSNRAQDYGLDSSSYSTQALFFDLDRDNDLDLFLLNHSIQSYENEEIPLLRTAIGIASGDKLFLNTGGKFIDITESSGIKHSPLGYGLGVAAGDLNGDGWTDLYVANDYAEPDYLYINNQSRGFFDYSKASLNHMSQFGMGVDIADFNNDGLPDIMVADMAPETNYRQKTNMASMSPDLFHKNVEYGFHYQYMFNTLQLNRGDLKFSEIAQLSNVSKTDWSWAALFGDLDNDGWKDLLVTNGFRREHSNKDFGYVMENRIKGTEDAELDVKLDIMVDLIEEMSEAKLANYVFQNQKDLRLQNQAAEWGLDHASFSNGASMADLDSDGDLDIVINNIDQEAFIYRNNSKRDQRLRSLRIRFAGPERNPFGIGAKVTLRSGDMTQMQENYMTRGYQSSVPPVLHFGLPTGEPASVEVQWPDGKLQTVPNVKAGSELVIEYKNASIRSENSQPKREPLFVDVTKESQLRFKHLENDYDDFEKEILLPHKMSQFGPALAVGDVNGDGFEDVYVGGAHRQYGRVFLQTGEGTFELGHTDVFKQDAGSEDVGAAFFDIDRDGDLDLYVASGGNEFNEGHPLLNDRLYLNDGNGSFQKASELIPAMNGSGGVVAPFDFDSDGDVDLFVGGRLVPQRYPIPADSYLLRNDDGKLVDVTSSMAGGLKQLGLVTSALWSDYDGDGLTDLVVAGEWMPVTIFKNSSQGFEKVDSPELGRHVGWWYSLAQHDFDGDGDMDYVAGNLGLNYKYQASFEEPFSIYADDFDNSGTIDVVLSYYNNGEEYPLRGKQCSTQQMPFVSEKFKTYHDFGLATIKDIYDPLKLQRSTHFEATNFAHSLIENKGNGSFQIRPLPNLAQISTVNGILVDDFDGDAIMDLVVAGNLYPVEVETTRADASYGLFLKGEGGFRFRAVDLQETKLDLGGDVKSLRSLSLGRRNGILAAVNDDYLRMIKVNGK